MLGIHCSFTCATIATYADDTTLYCKFYHTSDVWYHLELVYKLESDLWDTVDWYRKWLIGFIAGKTQLTSFGQYNNTGAIDMKRNGSVLKKTLCFNMLGLTFSSKLDRDSYIISIDKTASKKIGALICSIKLLSPEVTLYLCKSTIWPYMKYWNHVWDGAPICYLESLN